jgi:hypothetical protein
VPAPRGKAEIHRVAPRHRPADDETAVAPPLAGRTRPHPFLELGPEYALEVGCIKCLRVGTRAGWERGGWHCPFEGCKGTPEDVYPPLKTLLVRGPGPDEQRRLRDMDAEKAQHLVAARVAELEAGELEEVRT